MSDDAWEWWEARLAEYRADGRMGAWWQDFDPPHYANPDDDPQDTDENAAYMTGWHEGRRKEL